MPSDLDERLRRLALTDPVVAQCVNAYRAGTWTRDEMLVECVLALVERHTQLHRAHIQLLSEMPPGPLRLYGDLMRAPKRER